MGMTNLTLLSPSGVYPETRTVFDAAAHRSMEFYAPMTSFIFGWAPAATGAKSKFSQKRRSGEVERLRRQLRRLSVKKTAAKAHFTSNPRVAVIHHRYAEISGKCWRCCFNQPTFFHTYRLRLWTSTHPHNSRGQISPFMDTRDSSLLASMGDVHMSKEWFMSKLVYSQICYLAINNKLQQVHTLTEYSSIEKGRE